MMYECEYFLAIAAAKNLNRAAQALYISPSALSQFLSKLEHRLGVSLFVREKNSMRLTEAGLIYYEAAKQIEEIKQDMMERLEKLADPQAASLKIAVSGTRSLGFATFLWPILYEAFPKCSFYLSNDTSGHIYDQLLDQTLDFGVAALDYNRQEQYQFFPLHHGEVGLLIPASHRVNRELRAQGIAPEEPVDISVCRGETILLSMQGSIINSVCKRYFKQERFTPQRITCSLQGSMLEVARVSSVICMNTMGYLRDVDDFVFQRLKNPVYYDLGVICRRGRELTPVEQEFIRLAQLHKDKY